MRFNALVCGVTVEIIPNIAARQATLYEAQVEMYRRSVGVMSSCVVFNIQNCCFVSRWHH